MFKKLKDKIAEEVKSSPQRVQQLAQGVQAVVQGATGGLAPQNDNDSMFSLTEDQDDSFSSVSLKNAGSPSYKTRRNSNTSVASDVSFLPAFESHANLYHLQSDLDASASEIEDSYSGQLERVSKEQLLQAFRRMQMKYNKYRGRYTDLANHYRALERENGRVKSVLVETQDKALRRVSELKEQCGLEQSAKAHMENVLREDLTEKQYLIDTLHTKIQLLQRPSISDQLVSLSPDPDIIQKELEELRLKEKTSATEFEERLVEERNKKLELEDTISKIEGKVEEMMANLKNKEEEIVSFKEKSEKLITTVNHLENHKTELENRIGELEKELFDTKQFKNDLIDKEKDEINNLISEKDREIKDLKEAIENQVCVLEQNKIKHQELVIDLRQEIDNKATEIINIKQKLDVNVQDKNNQVQKTEDLEKILRDKDNDLTNLKGLVEEKTREMENYKTQHKMEQSELIIELQRIVSDKDKDIGVLKEELQRKAKEFDDFKLELMKLERISAEKMELLVSLNENLEERSKQIENKLKNATQDKDRLNELNKGLNESKNRSEKNTTELNAKLSNKDKELKELQKKIEELGKKKDKLLSEKQKEIDTLKETNITNVALMNEFKQTITAIETKLATLQEEIARERIEKTQIIDELNLRNVDKDVEIHKLNERLGDETKYMQEIKELKEEIGHKNKQINEAHAIINTHREEIEKLVKNENEWLKNDENQALKASLNDLKLELNNLQINLEAAINDKEILVKNKDLEISKLQKIITEMQAKSDIINQELQEKVDLLLETDKKYNETLKEKERIVDAFKNDVKTFTIQTERLQQEQLANNDKYAANEARMMQTVDKLQEKLKERDEAAKNKDATGKLITEENKQLKHTIKKLTAQLEAVKVEKKELLDEEIKIKADRNRVIKQIEDECAKRLKTVEDKLRDAAKEKEALEEETKHSKAKIIEDSNKAMINAEERFQNSLTEANNMLCDAIKEKELLRDEIEQTRLEINEKNSTIQYIEQEFDARLIETTAKLQEVFLEKQLLTSEIENIQMKIDEEKTILINDLQKQFDQRLSEITNKLDGVSKEKQILKDEIEEMLMKHEEEKNILKIHLEKQFNMKLAEYKNHDKVIKDEEIKQIKILLDKRDADMKEAEKNMNKELTEALNKLEVITSEKELLNEEINDIKSKIEDKNNSIKDELDEKLKETSNNLEEARKERALLEDELNLIKTKLEEQIEAQGITMNKFKEAMNNLEDAGKVAELLQEEMQRIKVNVDERDEEAKITSNKLKEAINNLEEARSEKELLEEELKYIKIQIKDDDEAKNNNLTDIIEEFNTKLNAATTETKNPSDSNWLEEKDRLYAQNITLINQLRDANTKLGATIQDTETTTEDTKNKLKNGHDTDKKSSIVGFETEIQELEAKVSLYENMELSAKESVQYLQNELDKMRNKNERLKTKLDETLVTLNHCADLSSSTEMEYLRNILYNYMIGKESVVLARVIAAVCKFDSTQTENVLQKEQQKQTLLGQLGIL